jgi:hypothetical protein
LPSSRDADNSIRTSDFRSRGKKNASLENRGTALVAIGVSRPHLHDFDWFVPIVGRRDRSMVRSLANQVRGRAEPFATKLANVDLPAGAHLRMGRVTQVRVVLPDDG